MKRQAMGNLMMPRAKKPAIQSSNTLHAYFSPRQTQTGDSVTKTPVADVEEDASSVDKISTDKKSVALSDEQQRVLRMVVRDEKNIFFTGSAGLLHQYTTPVSSIELRNYQARESRCYCGKS